MDVVGDDRFTVWEAAGENGPNSAAKTTAKCLTSHGNDAVVDADSQFSWLADGIALRPELEGIPVIYAKVQRESDQSDHSFNHPIFVDEATGNMILPGQNDGGAQKAQGTADSSSGGSEPDTSAAASDGGNAPLAEFYETCEELSINTEAAVLGLLEDVIADGDNDLTESMVDRDEILNDLVA